MLIAKHTVGLALAATLLFASNVPGASAEPERKSASQVAAELYLGILAELDLSRTNVVEKFAKAHGWTKLDPAQAELLNSRVSYFGELDGYKFMIGTDGTDDIFSIAIRREFSSHRFLEVLRTATDAKFLESDDSLGHKSEMYRLLDGDRKLGILMITIGAAPSIKGTGSVSFISEGRAAREGISQ